ncbi:MAG TPA: Gfo/Idh/MocA family oxidoreductase [Verrucomicrobiae bacterium]|nr:Gfo/Idh/MocA family oxidoreductase [Verrucomicrobiae bacterium]
MTQTGFAVIGCGLIGRKRAAALAPDQVVVACDTDMARAQALVKAVGHGAAVDNPAEAIQHRDVDAVIVATVNAALAPIALQAIGAGKHVLAEKPAGVSVAEVESLAAAAKRQGICVRVGFNHRYHPAFVKARGLVDAGELGPLMFLRARYGHGGRVGYEKEWRADPKLSGGGELIDQGVHLIDLSRWFLDEFTEVEGHVATYFWNMPVDDNAFLSLRTASGQTAWLHVSCTEWKNMFSLELYGRDAKLQIDGLGGSYGVEKLTFYKMKPEMGPPDTQQWEYPGPDESWRRELEEFQQDIASRRTPSAGLADARASLRIVETIYQMSGYPRKSL